MLVALNLNARLQPVHRAEMEDALEAYLRDHVPDVTLVGGATELGADGAGPMSCIVDVEMPSDDPTCLNRVIEALERLGAPKGSTAKIEGHEEIAHFGRAEGLALVLNGTDLPPDVYRTSDVNELITRLTEALNGAGSLVSWWEGRRNTSLYFYGQSFNEMRRRIEQVVTTHPLAQRSRVEQIA